MGWTVVGTGSAVLATGVVFGALGLRDDARLDDALAERNDAGEVMGISRSGADDAADGTGEADAPAGDADVGADLSVGCTVDADCDDGVACTTNACDPALSFTYTPDDAACDDPGPCASVSCDSNDGCVAIAKVDNTLCTSPGGCELQGVCKLGTCQGGGAVDCDDGNHSEGDGCGVDCKTEPGYACSRQPSVCAK